MSPRRRGRGGSRGGRAPAPSLGRGPAPERRPHEGSAERRGGRPPEPPSDDAAVLEEEIRAHREVAADARSGPGADAPSVAALTTFLRSLGIDPRRDPEYTVTAQLTADFLAERTAALRREPGPLRPSRSSETSSPHRSKWSSAHDTCVSRCAASSSERFS